MKVSKFASAVLVASAFIAAMPVEAASFGRSSSSSSSSSSRSSSSSSFSRPSAPAPSPSVAPSPSKPGGIGGTASMGVRKSEVTAPVAQKVEQSRPSTATNSPSQSNSYGSSTPTYGNANQPNYSPPMQSSGFGSSFAGALGGSILGNMLFSNHGSGGTTIVNNGGGGNSSAPVASSGQSVDSSGVYSQQPAAVSQKGYSMWSFIGDLISFVILVALLVGIAWLFYKGYKMVSAYVNRERGVGPTQPFAPTAKFWEIQKAFGAADEARLRTLLGPDLVDEATQNLVAQEVTLSKVSHEIALNNPREFSVHYKFEDAGETIDQVWHFELHDKVWVLNGIETV